VKTYFRPIKVTVEGSGRPVAFNATTATKHRARSYHPALRCAYSSKGARPPGAFAANLLFRPKV